MSDPKPDLTALKAELAALNAEWDAITAKRKAWMDAHMADFAKYPIGTALYVKRWGEASGGRDSLGKVVSYYRPHARDPLYDRHMEIHYRTDTGDNSSRQSGSVESREERVARLKDEAEQLSRPPLADRTLRELVATLFPPASP